LQQVALLAEIEQHPPFFFLLTLQRDPRSITFSVSLEYTGDVKRATVQVIRANGLPNLSKKGVSYVFAEVNSVCWR
jgi:hypothetical protein